LRALFINPALLSTGGGKLRCGHMTGSKCPRKSKPFRRIICLRNVITIRQNGVSLHLDSAWPRVYVTVQLRPTFVNTCLCWNTPDTVPLSTSRCCSWGNDCLLVASSSHVLRWMKTTFLIRLFVEGKNGFTTRDFPRGNSLADLQQQNLI
jgi:hypothetical protein